MTRSRKYLLILMGVAYATSLYLPGLVLANDTYGPAIVKGITLLCWGWWGLLAGNFAWFANPLLLIALLLSKSKKRTSAIVVSIVAFLVGLHSFAVTEWWYNEGVGTPISHLGSGYYVWQIVLLLAIAYCFLGEKKQLQVSTNNIGNGKV